MALTLTPRFGQPQWSSGADSPGRTAFNGAFAALDQKGALDPGLNASALPTADVVDGRYAQTVNGAYRQLYRRGAGAWQQVGGNTWGETQYERAAAGLAQTAVARERSHPDLTNPTVVETWDGGTVRGGRFALGEVNSAIPSALHVGDTTSAVDLAVRGRVYARTTAANQRGFVASAHNANAGNLYSAVDPGGSVPWLVDSTGRMRSQVPTAFGGAALTAGVPVSVAPSATDTAGMDLYAASGKPALRVFRALGDAAAIGLFEQDKITLGRATWTGGVVELRAPTLTLVGAFGLTGSAVISAGLTVTGTSTLGTLNAGTTELGTTTASALTVSGTTNLSGTVNLSGRLDLPTNLPSGTSAGQVRIAADYTLEVYDGSRWRGHFGSGTAANSTGRKHAWYQGNAALAGNDSYVQVTGFPNTPGGGSICTMSGGGNMLLNRAGLWVVIASAFLDHGRDGLFRVYLQWEGGAIVGRSGMIDVRKRDITFGKAGSGQAEAQITWIGYVTEAQAANPIKMFVAQRADDDSATTSTGWFLSAEYLGA